MIDPQDDSKPHWTIDKKVPLALMATIVMQTVAIVWWAATASARLDHLERATLPITLLGERVIRLEEKISVVQDGVADIKALIRTTGPPR